MESLNDNKEQMTATPALSKKTLFAILAYLGPLVVIPYFVEREDPFVKFHIGQGAVLLVIEVAAYFLGLLFWPLWVLVKVINLAVLILAIIGIVQVLRGEQKIVPIVGQYAVYLKI